MKKFGLALLILLIFGVAVFIAMILYGGGQQRSSADGLPAGAMKEVALRERTIGVVLADPMVQNFLNSSYGKCEPEYIAPGETGVYMKDSSRYAGVSFHISTGGEPISLKVIVDTTNMSEVGFFYQGLPPLMNSWLIIPPGNGIYDMMNSGFNLSSPNKYAVPEIGSYGYYNMTVTPAGARLCPIIINEDNFKKYMNGSPYEVPELIDPATRDRVRVDGSKPVTTEWHTNYILPPEVQSYTVSSGINTLYYLILVNRDAVNVKVVYGSPSPPIYK